MDVGCRRTRGGDDVKALLLFVAWCILFVLCWPVAVLAAVLLPMVWLVSLPLRLIGITTEALFALIRAVLFLPARLLGWREPGYRV
jgi:hypothetical protein